MNQKTVDSRRHNEDKRRQMRFRFDQAREDPEKRGRWLTAEYKIVRVDFLKTNIQKLDLHFSVQHKDKILTLIRSFRFNKKLTSRLISFGCKFIPKKGSSKLFSLPH